MVFKVYARLVLAISLLGCFSSELLAAAPREDEVLRLCHELLQERQRIKQLRFSAASSRIDGVKVRFQWWSDGDLRRVDYAELAFPKNPSQENFISRRAIRGSKLLQNHERFGAEISPVAEENDRFIAARWLGLMPQALVFLKDSRGREDTTVFKCTNSSGATPTTLSIVGKEYDASVFATPDQPGSKRFLLWDSNGEFIGCGFEDPMSLQVVIVREWFREDGIRFPSELEVVDHYNGKVRFDEIIHLTDIEINQPIDDSIFSLAGLGVQDGDSVTVRDGSLSGSDFDIGVFSDGKVLPLPPQRQANYSFAALDPQSGAAGLPWRMIFVGGNFIVAVALLVMYFLLQRRSHAQ